MHCNVLSSRLLLVNASLHFSTPLLLNGELQVVDLAHVALLSAVEPRAYLRTLLCRASERACGHPLSSAVEPQRVPP